MEKINASSLEKIEKICLTHEHEEGPVKLMLHDVQNELGYIPFEAMERISHYTGRSVADIYGVVTFYTQFTTVPKGKHVINVCLGTACYVNGGQNLLDKVTELTNTKVNETSEDGLFSVDATRCLGACGLAPVVVIDGKVYGNCNESDLFEEIIQSLVDAEHAKMADR